VNSPWFQGTNFEKNAYPREYASFGLDGICWRIFYNESKTGLAASLPGARRALWNRIKELTGWKASKVELEQSESEGEEGSFKYKIVY